LTNRIDGSIAGLFGAYVKLVSIEELALGLTRIGVVPSNVGGRERTADERGSSRNLIIDA